MAAPIDLTMQLEETISAGLAAAIARAEDLTAPMGEIASYLLERIEHRFATQTAPGGAAWLKAKRVQRVEAAKGKAETLTKSGELRRSMREDHGRDFAAAGPEAGGRSGRYAAAHQFGVDKPVLVPFHTRKVTSLFGEKLAGPTTLLVSSHMRRMRLPKREYLGFEAIDLEEAAEILLPWIGAPLGGVAA